MNNKSKIFNLIAKNDLEWLMIIYKKQNYNSKNFFRILHYIDYKDNVVIISDIENMDKKYYSISLHDCLYEKNLIKINSNSKILEIHIQQKLTENNFINRINNKFNINN
jgi:hypothetical protein